MAGIRYFQCEPSRGVFSRTSKLTREPSEDGLAAAAAAHGNRVPGTPAKSLAPKPHNGLTPAPSSVTRSAVKGTPKIPQSTSNLRKSSLTASTSSIGSESGRTERKSLRLGDRVLVSGTKTGTLRFMGQTDFAKGEWAGVELDDPQGKNDGSVAGKRYSVF